MTARKWIDYPKDIPLQCAYGPLRLAVTSKDHLVVGSPSDTVLNYHDRSYRGMNMHLFLRDGEWVEDANLGYTYWYTTPPPTFKAKLEAEVRRATLCYMAAHPDLCDKAQLAHLNNELIERTKKWEELSKQSSALLTEIQAMLREETDLKAKMEPPCATE